MLANERKTNTKAESSAAAGPFGGVKRIKKFGHGFRRDSDAIVLDRDDHTATGHRETDLDTARIAVSGLFSSCATPASIWPMAASFSDWMSCSSRRLRSVTSRPERMTPSILSFSSNNGLKLKRMRRHSACLLRTRSSRDAKLC